MAQHETVLYLADGGMNSRAPASRLPPVQYARATNVAIINQLPTTRPGSRVVPLSGDALDRFALENVQGAMMYNPARGQGGVAFGTDETTLLCAVGGRKLQISFEGRGLLTTGNISDISNGYIGDANLHLAWWAQWEKYALQQDGNGNCWIYDGANPATVSAGYNVTNKEASQVPNGGTVMAYAHARGCVVVNSHALLTGDPLNARDLGSPKDLLAFREQSYWATGTYFAPPSSMGAINAAAILPLQDTQHGHGQLMLHCQDGIFSVDLNIFPRANWSSTPMVKTAYLGSGAAGPYAVAAMDADQIFRSHVGVQTLRSAQAEIRTEGTPFLPISEAVDFFDADAPRWIRFTTVAVWNIAHRALISCYPMVSGRFRWNRGIVSLNFHPVPTKQAPTVWEGLWTLPPESAGIIQLVNGKFDSEERQFAICRGTDKRNRLVEFRPELTHDILEDGSAQKIRCQLITRRVDLQAPFVAKNFIGGTLIIENIDGRVEWGVWYRFAGETAWTGWRSGYVENTPSETDGAAVLESMPKREVKISLGKISDARSRNVARNVQFLIRWAGYCSVQCMRLTYSEGDVDDDKFESQDLRIRYCDRIAVDYDDYEYNLPEAESWLQTL